MRSISFSLVIDVPERSTSLITVLLAIGFILFLNFGFLEPVLKFNHLKHLLASLTKVFRVIKVGSIELL